MTRLACTVMVSLGVLLGVGATARAQDFEAAGKHFSAAQEAFGAKHFRTAAAEFEAAYGITKDPVLLYNVAESYEKAGDGHKAVANYKAYLKDQPAAQDKAEVQRRIKTIENKGFKLANQSAPGDNPPSAATSTAPATPPPTTPATPPPTTPATPPGTPPARLETPPGTPPPPGRPPARLEQPTPSTTQTSPAAPMTPPPGETVMQPTPEPTPAPQAATTTPPAPAEPPPGLLDEGPRSKLRVAAWIGVATTLAVLTAGAIFGLSAESRADEINRRLSFVDNAGQPHKFDQSMQSDLQSLKDDGNLYNGLAIGFYSVAAVAAVATVTMFIVDAKRGKAEKQHAWHVAPVVGKNAGGFALGGSF